MVLLHSWKNEVSYQVGGHICLRKTNRRISFVNIGDELYDKGKLYSLIYPSVTEVTRD